ncbi:endo-1,3-beta-glucanase Engl1 [Rhizodiscina lignyota]|uniref:Glucan endo-1,3-beta-D-glucosidase 1 n=1 Tax=Rhizodiscina lignyota TaxID=1504668 RepID=A0A9P4IQX9_9PEZI|nr:endo-1,3-beta-glucanase Engl1 [Rhizodiscina lignyota]
MSVSTEIAQEIGSESSTGAATLNTGGIFAPLPTGTSSVPVTISYSSSVPSIQSASTSAAPALGTVQSSLENGGRTSIIPFNTTVIPTPSSSLAPANLTLNPSITSPTASRSGNIFVPIATDAPPSNILVKPEHPVPRLGIENATGPIETNKFYANFFLGDQTMSTFTHPYSVSWQKGTGAAGSWGLAISHIERSQLAYGQGDPAQNFINPLGIESLILSAKELSDSTTLTTDSLEGFSVNVNLHPADGVDTLIQFPLVQGMGFVTGIYAGGTPLLQTGVFFNTVNYAGALGYGKNTFKYRITLNDNTNWLLYVTPKGSAGTPAFTLNDSSHIQGPADFFGTVQIAKNANGFDGEAVYDASAGAYAISGSVSASMEDSTGTYTLAWDKGGVTQNKLLMFALPHHLESMDYATSAAVTDVQLETTTKGIAKAVAADSITMSEQLPLELGFAPYHPKFGSMKSVSNTAVSAIADAAGVELNQNMDEQTNLDSMYFSGKGLAKFAAAVYTTNDIAGQTGLAAAALKNLEAAFATFVNNEQSYPLVYDQSWKGVVSSATYETDDSGVDFGNTYYNDHHFHYGYFVYTAAVIAYLDPDWLRNGTNKDWVSMLVRDYANPVNTDPYFPFSRNFDWYHGHSWAKGLFESGDGKDEESSSEDAFSTYAIKMWGQVSGDPNMEARGNLQLAVQARSLQNYFLLESDNAAQPPKFVGNKVTGILFENKVDHTTYFGTNIEYIQGIHMIPLNPSSSITRTSTFVQQEWDTYFSDGRADSVDSGWKGILYANLALTNPEASFQFFSQPDFDPTWLDGGASRTWYLAFAAGLGGA